jgi:YVTN family beta-propeller protein
VDVDQSMLRVYALDFSNGTPGTNFHEIDANTNIETADVTIGSRLQNIALDPDESRAYATDFVDGVIVIDTSSLTVVTNLPVSNLPHGVAVHPDLNRLYVTQLDSDTVTVIDTTTHAVVDTLSVGDTPQWIGVDLIRNKAFVTNEGDGTVSVIDLSTNTVGTDTIPVGADPLTVTIHEPAAKAYVYNLGDGTISVIDTINETVIATIDVLFADGFESGDTSAWSGTMP